MYPITTGSVLIYLGFQPFTDFNVSVAGAIVTVEWLSALPQPTEAEITAAAASPEFAAWQAENGGDPLLTLRRQAKVALSESKAESALVRAALLIIVDEFNRHSDAINGLLDAIANASNLATIKSAAAAIPQIPQRTGAQLRTAALNRIDSGDADG